MYWNELNPQKRNVAFKFDNSHIKIEKNYFLKKFKTTIFDFTHLFFSSSNIHGFSHLTDEKRHFIEKYVLLFCTILVKLKNNLNTLFKNIFFNIFHNNGIKQKHH